MNFYTLSEMTEEMIRCNNDNRFEENYCEYAEGCIVECEIGVYGYENDENVEDYPKGERVGKITGYLILNSQANKNGVDLYDAVDDISSLTEYIYSAMLLDLDEESDVSSFDETERIRYSDIFCIKTINLEQKYSDIDMFMHIMELLPKAVFWHYHVFPDILAVYPTPLEFKKSLIQDAKERIADIVLRDRIKNVEKKLEFLDKLAEKYGEDYVNEYLETEKNAIKELDEAGHLDEMLEGQTFAMLDEEQAAYILGKYHKNNVYPASAIDKEEWSLFISAGFTEYKETRVLYKFTD